MDCTFCRIVSEGNFLMENEEAIAFYDSYPLNPGHALVVPKRHEADFFRLRWHEQNALWRMLPSLQKRVSSEHPAQGWNIGINVGASAGQTIDHVHLHLVPRIEGDVDDPRGGIRWVVPERARYWD